MALIDFNKVGNQLTIALKGHVDSANAAAVEKEIAECRDSDESDKLVIDAADLSYIASAGLRIILRLRKSMPNIEIVNVSPEVYEILDMTGFTEMISVKKAYRRIEVDGCEVIGQGANGKVYRLDPDTIVKVYFNPDALPEIQRERELARTAFVLGIPTAIPFDVVRVGDGYGSVFELLNAKSYGQMLESGEKTVDEIAEMSIELLKQIHATEVKPDTMPDMKEVATNWVAFVAEYLPAEEGNKLKALVEAVPEDHHMMHGDYHINNVMIQNGESLLIDMDTLCYGHPVFELASMYNAYVGYSETDHQNCKDFLGIDYDMSCRLWNKMLHLYLESDDEDYVKSVEEKAQVIGYSRIMRRTIRRKGLETPEGRLVIDNAKEHIMELMHKVDSLVF